MNIILEQAESVKIHALRSGIDQPSAVVTIGQGSPGRCHIEIVCGERKHGVAINGDNMTVASGMSTGSEIMREQSFTWKQRADRLSGVMQNDILSAIDDCIALGMGVRSCRAVVSATIAKALAP